MEQNDVKDDEKSASDKVVVPKTATQIQRMKLEKLMKNPEKPVDIPEGPRERSLSKPPDFVRNVMGSSAGAGSGEFHVYRHIRRREYARQQLIEETGKREDENEAYHEKLNKHKTEAEARTAKKRAKRLKKKEKMKEKKFKKGDDRAGDEARRQKESDESGSSDADRSDT
ncbi:PREDICTED: PRKR-interacting protein 1 homolog [Priapulus caudatus]|uniref:PRKR-interacting protein 1 homolog n=1 Tax=Priapulus caudatus TaxID=37621 RepID=A0ABM1E757_PRICU|nr:PREDICTED: PRKR-interacting protein 1 homolog [Priapulus caudatus]